MKLDDAQVEELIERTMHSVRPTMRRVVGDKTPKQYDRADELSMAVRRGIILGLYNMGLSNKEAE